MVKVSPVMTVFKECVKKQKKKLVLLLEVVVEGEGVVSLA